MWPVIECVCWDVMAVLSLYAASGDLKPQHLSTVSCTFGAFFFHVTCCNAVTWCTGPFNVEIFFVVVKQGPEITSDFIELDGKSGLGCWVY